MLRCCPEFAAADRSVLRVSISTPDAELLEMPKYSVEIRDPQDQHDHYNAIQNRFDLSLHWDKPVHKPQQKPCCDKRDQDSGKWHIVFSERLHRLGPHSFRDPETGSVLLRCFHSGLVPLPNWVRIQSICALLRGTTAIALHP